MNSLFWRATPHRCVSVGQRQPLNCNLKSKHRAMCVTCINFTSCGRDSFAVVANFKHKFCNQGRGFSFLWHPLDFGYINAFARGIRYEIKVKSEADCAVVVGRTSKKSSKKTSRDRNWPASTVCVWLNSNQLTDLTLVLVAFTRESFHGKAAFGIYKLKQTCLMLKKFNFTKSAEM